MPDASERIRTPAPRPARPASPARAARFARTLRATDRRIVAAAALAAMMIGIVINATALQHGRRSELGLTPAPAAVAAVKPVAPAPAPVAPPAAVAEAAPEPPPAAEAPKPPAHAEKTGDAIANMLREKDPDKRKLTRAAQAALAKLGFDVRPTGALDADTRTALHKFEKSRKLPASAEITPKLVKTLKAAAADE